MPTATEEATDQQAGPWFYAGNGLCFRRRADGAVQIGRKGPMADDEVGVERTIGSDTWASVVAHVAAESGTAESFAAASALHAAS